MTMKVIARRTLIMLLSAMVMSSMIAPVFADTRASEAKEAYEGLLMTVNGGTIIGWDESLSGKNGSKFALIDMDKNGVPELVVTGDNMYHSTFYTYINKKVKVIGGGFSGSVKFYPNKKLIVTRVTHTGDDAKYHFRFDGRKFRQKAMKHGCDYENLVTGKAKKPIGKNGYKPYVYYKNGKKVTVKKYKKYTKKLMKKAKREKLHLHSATVKNIEKYLG